MGDRVWLCTREPLFELLSAPLHPCVILMVIFSGLTFGAWRRERWRRVAYDLWRYLLFVALLVGAFFLLVALLTRFAFGADPSAILRWVPAARAVAAALAGFLVWRDRHTTPDLLPAPRWWFRLRWAVLSLVLAIAVRPWIPNTNWLLSGPYEILEAMVDFPTVYVASDECLAARVFEYEVVSSHLSSFVGQPAHNELQFRGSAAVPGMARFLSQQLELDALRPGFSERHQSELYGTDTTYTVSRRANFGALFLITQIAKQGGADPVLRSWAERGPSPRFRASAAMALECVRLKRQSVLNVYNLSCGAPGELCTVDRCYKNLGKECNASNECFSGSCGAGRCCQSFGEACTAGTECCLTGNCVRGRCALGSGPGEAQSP